MGVLNMARDIKKVHPNDTVMYKVGNFVQAFGKDAYIRNIREYSEVTDITIQYEEGMTWKQFLTSKYNVEKLLKEQDSPNYVVYKETNYYIRSDNMQGSEIINSVIDKNIEYYFDVNM